MMTMMVIVMLLVDSLLKKPYGLMPPTCFRSKKVEGKRKKFEAIMMKDQSFLAEVYFDRRKSLFWQRHPYVSYFAIYPERALQPRWALIDKSQHKARIGHSEAGKEARKHFGASMNGRS